MNIYIGNIYKKSKFRRLFSEIGGNNNLIIFIGMDKSIRIISNITENWYLQIKSDKDSELIGSRQNNVAHSGINRLSSLIFPFDYL